MPTVLTSKDLEAFRANPEIVRFQQESGESLDDIIIEVMSEEDPELAEVAANMGLDALAAEFDKHQMQLDKKVIDRALGS